MLREEHARLRAWLESAAEACEQSSEEGDGDEGKLMGKGLRRLAAGKKVDMYELQLHAICVTRMKDLIDVLRPHVRELWVEGGALVAGGGQIPAGISDYAMLREQCHDWWTGVLGAEIRWASTILGGVGLVSPRGFSLRQRGAPLSRFFFSQQQHYSETMSRVEAYQDGVVKLKREIVSAERQYGCAEIFYRQAQHNNHLMTGSPPAQG